MHSAYLHKALRSFEGSCDVVGGSLFIYGHSLDSADDHIFQKISDGKIRNVYIGTRGDMNSEKNIRRIQKAQEIENKAHRENAASSFKHSILQFRYS